MPAIILAAGASRRLGQAKQLLRVDGEGLLGRTIRIVGEAGAEPVLVVLGAHAAKVAGQLDLAKEAYVHLVENIAWESGIASSIHAGMRALLEHLPEADAVMLLVCDQPRLTSEHLKMLMAAHESGNRRAIVASFYRGIAGVPAVFPRSQFSRLMELKGDVGARALLRNPDCAMVTVAFNGGEMDVDTPEDLIALAGADS